MIKETELNTKVGELLNILYVKRFATLEGLTLSKLLNKKNPYLYRGVGVNDPSDLIEGILSAFVSSSDETIFGNDFFEPMAKWSADNSNQHSGGERTVTVGAGAGQDIAIETANAYLAISVKSGVSILNSQSTKGQNSEFEALQSRLRKLNKQFRPIIGYGYGRRQNRVANKTEKVAGQLFWELLTGETDYYLRIARSIGIFGEKHYEEYKKAFERKKVQLLREFILNFVGEDGSVLWDAVVTFNSSKDRPKSSKKSQTDKNK